MRESLGFPIFFSSGPGQTLCIISIEVSDFLHVYYTFHLHVLFDKNESCLQVYSMCLHTWYKKCCSLALLKQPLNSWIQNHNSVFSTSVGTLHSQTKVPVLLSFHKLSLPCLYLKISKTNLMLLPLISLLLYPSFHSVPVIRAPCTASFIVQLMSLKHCCLFHTSSLS